MSKRLSKYIASFDYLRKSLIVLCATSGSFSIASFATVIGPLIGTANTSFSLPFSVSTRIVKKLLKTTRNKNKKHNKIFMLAMRKLNNEISHEDFMTVTNKERNNQALKESIRMMKTQWWKVREVILENIIWLKQVKKIGIDEVINRNEIVNNSLKSQI